MSKSLYITAAEARSGKSAIVLGLMQLLLRQVDRAAIFRPIINRPPAGERDRDLDLIITHFKLDIPFERAYAYTLSEVRALLNEGKEALVFENILRKYKELEKEYDFILCEGTDYLGDEAALEFDINAEIAVSLCCPVLCVTNGKGRDPSEIASFTQRAVEALEEKGAEVAAAIINRLETDDARGVAETVSRSLSRKDAPLLVYAVPEVKSLGNPTMKDYKKWLKATVLYGHGRLDSQVDKTLIAAMQIGNFLNYIEENALVITPGDRSDIVLASLASRLSTSYPNISGVILTGGLEPPASIHRLIEGWTGVPVPILAVAEHTHQASQIISHLHGKIDPEDGAKIATALGAFEAAVNVEELGKRIVTAASAKVTPRMFEYNLIEKAKAKKQRIVLPEGSSERILKAADIILRRQAADVILIGNREKMLEKASGLGVSLEGASIVDPVSFEHYDDYVETYFKLRSHKGIRMEDARDRLADPTYFGTMMVYKGHADGMVSGSVTTTAQTIRPAFEFIKTKPGASIVSSVFLMCLKDRVLAFGDCAVNPNPTARELAEIAVNSAQTAALFGVEPRVAMLSYSTGASGKGEQVEKVAEAARLAKELAPGLPIEGPIQYDAAIDPETARTKMPGSEVAGRATVFIFPDLNTGNNTYKAVQRSASDVLAIGPILQGLNRPVNDLSRGCLVADIINTVAITAIQAQAEKERA